MKKILSVLICLAMAITMLCPIFAMADSSDVTGSDMTESDTSSSDIAGSDDIIGNTVTVLLGDANGDGKVNTADATVILRHCAELAMITDPVRLVAADANKNGEVNTADATYVLRAVAFSLPVEEIEVPTTDEPSSEPVTETPDLTTPPVSEDPIITETPTPSLSEEPVTEPPTVDPSQAPVSEAPVTEPPTVNPSQAPVSEAPVTEPPTVDPSQAPVSEAPVTEPPTQTPTTEPTETPDWPSNTKCFYGNTYRGSDMQLVYSETIVKDARPMNAFTPSSDKSDEIELQHTLLNGKTITRTFEETGESYEYEGEIFVQVKETTNWAAISNIRPVEKVAGATCANSVSLASLSNTNSSSILGTEITKFMYVLIEDIDWNGGNWVGIGGGGMYYASTYFYSYFDGMGYSVNKIKVRQAIDGANSNQTSAAGFFGKLYGGGVANLILTNADVRLVKPASGINMYSAVGILAAQAYSATITNCHTSGFAENLYSPWGTGGILGYSQTVYLERQGYVSISKCSSTASLSADRSGTAGILGKCIGPYNTLDECWYNGMITSKSTNVGGIVGWVSDSTTPVVVKNCWTAGKYLGVAREGDPSSAVCGLVGSNKGVVTNCYTTAFVFITLGDPSLSNPSFNTVATYTFYLVGRYYVNGTSVVNFDPVTDDFVSIDFAGYLTTGYNTVYGGTGVSSPSSLMAVINGTMDIWSTAGTFPQLINNYGTPIE